MPISVTCAACQKSHRMPDHLAGKRVRCPACKEPIEVIAEVEAAEVEPTRPVAQTTPARQPSPKMGTAGPTARSDGGPPAPKKSGSALVVVVLLGLVGLMGVGCLGGGGVLIWYLVGRDKPVATPPATPAAAKPAPTRTRRASGAVPPGMEENTIVPAARKQDLGISARSVQRLAAAGGDNGFVAVQSRSAATGYHVHVLGIADFRVVADFDVPQPRVSPSIFDVCPTGQHLVVELQSKKFTIYSVEEKRAIVQDFTQPAEASRYGVDGFYLLPQGRAMTVTGHGDLQALQIPEMTSLWKYANPVQGVMTNPIKQNQGVALDLRRTRAAVFDGEGVQFVDLATGKSTGSIAALTEGGRCQIRGMAFSPDGKQLAALAAPRGAGGTNPFHLVQFDIASGNRLASIRIADLTGPTPQLLTHLAWASDKAVIVSDSGDRGCFVFEPAKPTSTLVMEVPTSKGRIILGHNDGRLRFVSAMPTDDNAMLVDVNVPEGITGDLAGPPVRGRTLLLTPLGIVKPLVGPGMGPLGPGGPGPFGPGPFGPPGGPGGPIRPM